MIAAAAVQPNVLLVRGELSPAGGSGTLAAPASGATIIIYASPLNCGTAWRFSSRFSRICLELRASHDSAVQGLSFLGSTDGTNWRQVFGDVTYLAGNGFTTYDLPVYTPHVKLTYTNSANTLTAWELALYGVRLRSVAF